MPRYTRTRTGDILIDGQPYDRWRHGILSTIVDESGNWYTDPGRQLIPLHGGEQQPPPGGLSPRTKQLLHDLDIREAGRAQGRREAQTEAAKTPAPRAAPPAAAAPPERGAPLIAHDPTSRPPIPPGQVAAALALWRRSTNAHTQRHPHP